MKAVARFILRKEIKALNDRLDSMRRYNGLQGRRLRELRSVLNRELQD